VPRVYVSIGSNVEREQNVRAAVRALRASFKNVETSPVYQSRAEGFDGDDFYNLAARFDTDEPLEGVCERLTAIETAQGRVRTGARFAPRTLDIDVLLYGDLIRHDDRFDIPRRDILAYAHVLGPLATLAPDLLHPETGGCLADRWRQFAAGNTLRVVPLDLESAK
jgi:2-amino-4-hydroxy-6-hydroxymethyldihydropteridine diphosphokinase